MKGQGTRSRLAGFHQTQDVLVAIGIEVGNRVLFAFELGPDLLGGVIAPGSRIDQPVGAAECYLAKTIPVIGS